MTFPIKNIANSFLQWDFRDGSASITPMKMQKLVYLAHGWHLAVFDRPLIEESFEAWPYGPVEEGLYNLFKGYRNNVITNYAKTWAGNVEKSYVVASSNEEFKSIFDAVINKYGAFPALKLSSLTHQDGTPWSITKANGESAISNTLIRDHFRGLIAND